MVSDLLGKSLEPLINFHGFNESKLKRGSEYGKTI